MKNRPGLKFLNIHKSIRENFDFLFDRGFRIVAAMFLDNDAENWEVTLLANDWFIRVHYVQGRVSLGFTTLPLIDEIGFLDLGTLLQFIGKGNDKLYNSKAKSMNERQQIKSIAQLFRRYFNELIIGFDDLYLLTLDPLYPVPTNSINGQLFMDNCPFYFSC